MRHCMLEMLDTPDIGKPKYWRLHLAIAKCSPWRSAQRSMTRYPVSTAGVAIAASTCLERTLGRLYRKSAGQ